MEARRAGGPVMLLLCTLVVPIGAVAIPRASAAAAPTYGLTATIPVTGGADTVAIDPSTDLAYVVGGSGLSTIDLTTDDVVARLGEGGTTVAVDAATDVVYLANPGDNFVDAIDGATDREITAIDEGTPPDEVAVDGSTDTIYTADTNGTLSVIDGTTDLVTASVPDLGTSVSVDPSTDTIYVLNRGDGTVSVVAGATDEVTDTLSVASGAGELAIDPATDSIFVTNADGSLSVIDGATNDVTATIDVGENPLGVAVDPSADTIYVANQGDHSISVIDGVTEQVAATVAVPAGVFMLDVDAATHDAYVASFEAGLSVIGVITDPRSPVFTADSPPSTLTLGSGYYYRFTATGSPEPTFVAPEGVPTGLRLDAQSGVLSGTPTTPSAGTYTFEATNGVSPDAISPTLRITVSAPTPPGELWQDQALTSGQEIQSPGGEYTLVMQADGNLVEYLGTRAVFNTRTFGHPGARVVLQDDGNLVVYSPTNVALWSSRTDDGGSDYLALQNDGNLVLYDVDGGGAVVKDVGVLGGLLGTNQTLSAGQELLAPSCAYNLIMQSDGNLVEYAGTEALFNTGTDGDVGDHAIMQSDGNFVVYSKAGEALFNTRTDGHPGSSLSLQSDADLVVYQGTKAIYANHA